MKLTLSVIFALLFSCQLFAQWTSNTAVNTIVCDTTGEQSVTKQALCSDGTTYYAWFDNRGGAYAVYLQKLDANGVRQFGSAGLLISSNPQNSSLVDWDMIADNSNNAVITFTDVRAGGTINPFAYLVSPAGTMLWGANGVALTDSLNSFQPNPHVAQTSDGNYVFMWRLGSGPQKIAMQKLNAAGVKQWGSSPMVFSSGTAENYDWPNLVTSDNGAVIAMWSGYTGNFLTAANYKIYTQKFSAAGTRVWNATQDTVYSLGRVGGFYTPRIFSDGINGAIYCWRDDRNSQNLYGGYVQRKNAAGTFLFPVNGSAVSTQAGMNHFDPQAAYMPATGETVAIFYQSNSGQTLWGFSGQKFSANGTAMWGTNGINYIPLGNNQPGIYACKTLDTNAFIYINESQFGSGNNLVKAFRVGKSGGYVWPGNIITAGSSASGKVRLNASVTPSGMSILSWQDQRADNGNVYAQNINFDGTAGLTGIINYTNNSPAKFSLGQNYPNPFNPSTIIKFAIPVSAGNANVKLVLFDVLGRTVQVLLDENKPAGTYELNFNASHLSSGVYFYKLTVGENSDIKKMTLIK